MLVPAKYIFILLLLLALLGGCAKPPRQELQAARMAIAQAEGLEAAVWAPEEFARASETLREGEALLRQGDYELASVLLPRARELARQALIRTEEEKAAFERMLAYEEMQAEAEPPTPPQKPAKPLVPPAKSKPKPTPEPPARVVQPPRITVEVSQNQTLWLIAARKDVYDDPLLWPLLYQANRDQIRDPRQIHPGQILKIPRDISRREREEAREKARKSEIFAEYRLRQQPATHKSP